MQLLCIAALLLSAVAAQPGSWRPWQDGEFPPAGGPKAGADSKRGDDEQSVTQAPEDGDGGSGADWPEWDSGHPVWLHEMPPWFPNIRPGNGKRPMKPTDRQLGRLSQVSSRGKRQAPGFMSDEPGKQSGRHRGRSRGKRPDRRRPEIVFSPVFKVDSMTFQSITDVTLKEGENIFLMLKGGRHRPLKNRQYVKLIYNATEPNEVSIEFGVLKPLKLGEFVGKEDNPEEDYWQL